MKIDFSQAYSVLKVVKKATVIHLAVVVSGGVKLSVHRSLFLWCRFRRHTYGKRLAARENPVDCPLTGRYVAHVHYGPYNRRRKR